MKVNQYQVGDKLVQSIVHRGIQYPPIEWRVERVNKLTYSVSGSLGVKDQPGYVWLSIYMNKATGLIGKP